MNIFTCRKVWLGDVTTGHSDFRLNINSRLNLTFARRVQGFSVHSDVFLRKRWPRWDESSGFRLTYKPRFWLITVRDAFVSGGVVNWDFINISEKQNCRCLSEPGYTYDLLLRYENDIESYWALQWKPAEYSLQPLVCPPLSWKQSMSEVFNGLKNKKQSDATYPTDNIKGEITISVWAGESKARCCHGVCGVLCDSLFPQSESAPL